MKNFKIVGEIYQVPVNNVKQMSANRCRFLTEEEAIMNGFTKNDFQKGYKAIEKLAKDIDKNGWYRRSVIFTAIGFDENGYPEITDGNTTIAALKYLAKKNPQKWGDTTIMIADGIELGFDRKELKTNSFHENCKPSTKWDIGNKVKDMLRNIEGTYTEIQQKNADFVVSLSEKYPFSIEQVLTLYANKQGLSASRSTELLEDAMNCVYDKKHMEFCENVLCALTTANNNYCSFNGIKGRFFTLYQNIYALQTIFKSINSEEVKNEMINTLKKAETSKGWAFSCEWKSRKIEVFETAYHKFFKKHMAKIYDFKIAA